MLVLRYLLGKSLAPRENPSITHDDPIKIGDRTTHPRAVPPMHNFLPDNFPPDNSPSPVTSPPGHFPPGPFPLMKSMHGNNVVWLCAKYAVDANLFRLESSILTRAKRLTNRNNVGGEYSLGEYTGVERSGDNFPGESYLQHRDLQPENTLPRLLPNGQSCAVYRRILVAISIAEAAQ